MVCVANNGGILDFNVFIQTKNNLLESFNELHRVTAVLQVENCSLNRSGPLEEKKPCSGPKNTLSITHRHQVGF